MMATISDSGTVALLTTAGPLQIVDAAGNPAGQDFPLPPDAAYGHFSFQCQSSDGRILLGVQEATSTPDGFMRGRLICLNPTGHFLWEHRFRSPLTLPPAISPSGITYLPLSPDPGSAPDETDGLLAISPSGEFLWRWSPPGSLSTAPAVWDDGTVWVASTEPAFYRISPSGTMIRRVPLPGPVRGRPSPSPAGHWWLAGATGFQVVPTDFTVGHTVSAPATVADEALASNDGQMVFGVADAATYKGSPDGAHWGVMLPTTGFPWAITSSNTCAVASASGIDEVSLSPSLRRRLTTAGHRITPVTVGPTGLAVFGTLEGAWYAAMLTAPLGGSVWPHVGHDSRFSGATQVPFGRPGAPLSMTASTNAFRGSVILRWGSPTNAEFYALFRRGPGDPSDGVKVIDQLVGDTTYTDAPPIVGATYDYWAVAYNHTGAGPASKIVSFKVPVPRPGDLLVGSSIAGAAIGPVALGFDDSVYAALQVTNTAGATTVGWGLAAFSPNLSLRWFHPTAAPPAFGPAVAPTGTILCTQAGGLLEALSPDGTVLWQVSLGGDILAPPAIDPDGRIYVCHSLVSVVTYGPCKVEAFAPSGARLWETVVPDSTGSAQLLLTGDGRLVVEGGSSSTPWMRTYETNGAPFAPPTPSAAYLSLLAITGKGNAVTHDGTNLRVIRPDTSLAWQRNAQTDLPRRDAIVGPGDILYPLGLFGTVSRMTSESQSIIATLPSTPGPMVLDRDGTLYGGSADGVLRAFTTNGVSQWSVRLDGDLSTHSPALGSNGILYAVAPNGQLYAVYSGSTLAPAPWACEGANAQRSYLGHASTLPLMAPVLSASYGQFADGVHLHWAPVDGAWEYAVTRSESPDPLGAVTVAANLPAGDLVDTHVEEDLEYWYWVVARAGDRIEVAPAPVLGLRRSPVRGDTLLLGPTSSPGLSIALTPEGEPRILGGDRLMTYSRHLDPTAQVSLTFPVIPPLVITPAGALCYRSGDMLLRTNQIVVLSQEGQLAWTWTASPSSTLISEPAVGTDGTLYVSQSSGKVAAIGSGGALRWEVDCQQPLTLAPSVSADGVVVIVGALGDAFAISERGKLLWQHKGLNALLSPTFSTEGNVLLANSSSDLSLSGYRSLSLVALDVGTGDELWRSPTIPFTGGAMPPLIGTGNKIWFEASGSIMQTNRLILSEGYSPSGTLTPKLAQATVSLGTGIAVMADGLEVLRIPLPHHTLQVSDDQGIAAFTASVNGLSDPSSILLDNDGWLLALLAPGEFLLEEVFVGSPAASTCWPMWRADSQRSGRASRRVTPKVGPVEYFNGSRVIPISVDVALGLGTPASMELLVDGVVLPSDFPTPTGALTRWPAEKVGLHQLTVQLTYPDGNSTTDGPWSFGLPMPPLTVTTVAEGLRISVDSSLGVSYQLESSPDLLTWAPVSAPVPGNGGTIDWPLVSASGALPGTTFYRLMVNP
ncbi:MAG TPA: hypothetical protein DCM86_04880 [Verrucomicrobiales bacterium]|nr:hypothetical protein [Verrucomicrobiales bacterium]